ncbi:MAG: hypothetical protein RsTaC01_0609 [Candidatus Paraimprobicoccus trichonymphae]|uniref:Uncharacterized protein n=1 Tax=Candidatus Paraimprobicoccus trichonymphae TaxID=3033793 RepID=A0AA48I2V0_9FIRM|nr:MAG: hypothetical protein RsTaC01_0609 [Candidatus Paraimprobicoccus trichonymphae]
MIFSVAKIIDLYGHYVTIISSENQKKAVKTFIYPLRDSYKNIFINENNDNIPDNNELYVYLGKPKVRLDNFNVNKEIKDENQNFLLKKAEAVKISKKIIYIRVFLIKE